MEKTYRVSIYGKEGCAKCKTLKERLQALLQTEEWSDFGLEYNDVGTEEGLISFVNRETLNPQRIPSFVVEKRSTGGGYRQLRNPQAIATTDAMRPPLYVGIETDYSAKGRGVITPVMLKKVLSQAKSL